MKTETLVVELTAEELAILKAHAEREERLPYQVASRLLRRELQRESTERLAPA
jgi:hypothetical protein